MEKVVDIHKKKGKRPYFDIYIGRRIWGHPEFIRSSKWRNGYRVKDFGLELSMKYYEKSIRRKIAQNPEYYNLNELEDKILGCWCVNSEQNDNIICHGQILIKLLKERRELIIKQAENK